MPFVTCRCGHPSNRHGRGKTCRYPGCDCEEFVNAAPAVRAPRDAEWYRQYHASRGRRSWEEYSEDRHVHPSLNCYKRHGCRCEGCQAWNRVECRNERDIAPWRHAVAP